MDKSDFSVKLGDIIKKFDLEVLNATKNFENILMKDEDVSRPGMQIAGFFEYFQSERIQILGKGEATFLDSFLPSRRLFVFDKIFSYKIPVMIITRGIEPFPECIEAARKNNVPILRTKKNTATFISELTTFLKLKMSPKITIHGTLVDVYGDGVLMLGESGIGKSETALELITRGHRLIADDAVEITKTSDALLQGESPELTRYYMEVRGIGVIDIRRIHGLGAVKQTQRIDLIVHLEQWENFKNNDRLGEEEEFEEILGVSLPSITIPVAAGRNIAIIIEIASMNNRQRRMGINSAQELSQKILLSMQKGENEEDR